MNQAAHQQAVCTSCGPIIRCGTCGNNCCNGGYGKLADGADCPDCPSAYALQEELDGRMK